MRSILRERPLLGDALLGAFKHSLGEQDLSPVTARGYLHDLGRFRGWLEGEAGAKPRDLRRVTTVELVQYRQHLLRTERLQATTGLSRNKRKNRTLRSKVLGACDLGRLSGLDDRCLLACREAESLVRQMTIECCLRNMQSGADVMR